jgi:hypothetical protein
MQKTATNLYNVKPITQQPSQVVEPVTPTTQQPTLDKTSASYKELSSM